MNIKMKKVKYSLIILVSIAFICVVSFIWRLVLTFPYEELETISLGGNYVFNEDVICKIEKNKNLYLAIPDHIENYNYDDNYIVVRQLPVFDIADYYWIGLPSVEKDSINRMVQKCRNIGTCFWIVDKNKDKTTGPLTKQEYKLMCNSLHISLSLDK